MIGNSRGNSDVLEEIKDADGGLGPGNGSTSFRFGGYMNAQLTGVAVYRPASMPGRFDDTAASMETAAPAAAAAAAAAAVAEPVEPTAAPMAVSGAPKSSGKKGRRKARRPHVLDASVSMDLEKEL